MSSPNSLRDSAVALVCAHPGHELKLFGWLELCRPLVEIITDGSGGAAVPRTRYSRDVLAKTGARAGAVFGAVSDRLLYSWILEGNLAAVSGLVKSIADDLTAHSISTVICDGYEGYNPAHDLAHAIAFAAAAACAQAVVVFQFPVVGRFDVRFERDIVELSEEEFARKLRAARAYLPLADEIDAADAADEPGGLQREALTRVDSIDLDRFAHTRPFYETFGEQQVASGRYRHVIRYDAHVKPLLEHLAAVEVASAL